MPSAAEAGKLGRGSFQGFFGLSSVIYKPDPALYGPLVGHPETQHPAQLDFCSQCCWGRKGSPSKHVSPTWSQQKLHVPPGGWQEACQAIVWEGAMART